MYGWSSVSCITHVCDDFQADSSVWLSKSLLVGAGECCGGPTAVGTACLGLMNRYDTTPLTPACPKVSDLATENAIDRPSASTVDDVLPLAT